MACNCKNISRFEDEHGTPAYESFLERMTRQLWKVLLFFIAVMMVVAVTPCVLLYVLFKMFWGRNRNVPVPAFIRKYLKKRNG